MTLNRRSLLASGLGLGLSVAANQPVGAKEFPERVLRLGQSLPLTGPHANLGSAYMASARATFKELNSSTQDAPLIELIAVDDGGQSERTATNVKLLASSHAVHALFGFVGNGADRVGSRAAAAEGLPYIAPVSGSIELRTPNATGTFTFRASHADEIRYIAKHVDIIGVTKLALVYEYNFMGWELRDTVLDLIVSGRQRDVALTSIDSEGSEYSVPGAVESILAKRPQAVILGSNAVATASFVRAMRSAGFRGYFYALSSVGTQGLGKLLGPSASGISVTQVVPFALSMKTQVARKHRAFCDRNGLVPSAHSMEAWLGATMLFDAAKKIRTPGPKAVMESLASAAPVDFGGYTAQWHASSPIPKAYVDLAVHDRYGRLID
jgi:ABC-type branched-subunit amino acid transport system substrate-binding protein